MKGDNVIVDQSAASSDNVEDGGCHEASLLLSQPQCPTSIESAEVVLGRARRLLYFSHLFAQFSEVSWQFCLILFLAAFSNYESLILVSSYGLVSSLSVSLFGSAAGRFVDGSDRLFAAQRFIWTENVAVLVATTFCYYLLARLGPQDGHSEEGSSNPAAAINTSLGLPTDPLSIFLLMGIHVLGSAAMVLDSGFLVAMERDWIVVMSRYPLKSSDLSEDEKARMQKCWLSETNVTMKQIDLSCKVVAPAVAGYFVAVLDDGTDPHHGSNLRGAALLVGILNALALIVEYICTAAIYRQIPDLATKLLITPLEGEGDNVAVNICTEDMSKVAKRSTLTWKRLFLNRIPEPMRIYIDQSVSWAGIGLALLYLNILTFGGVMTAFLVWRGMRLEVIGVWRGISSAIGLAGTFAYRVSTQHLSVVATGMWSIVFQFCCISLSFASFFVEKYDTSMFMLVAGVCASRVGLWVFDISVTQLMQEHVHESARGLVGGVQQSLNSFFQFLSFAIGLVIFNPSDFYLYVGAGYFCVGLAVVCYYFGTFLRQH